MYHDVQCAEVIAFQGHDIVLARYGERNPAMCSPDEKSQINRFLGELLDWCLAKGEAQELTSDSALSQSDS